VEHTHPIPSHRAACRPEAIRGVINHFAYCSGPIRADSVIHRNGRSAVSQSGSLPSAATLSKTMVVDPNGCLSWLNPNGHTA
jgi:hypothetical protein